MSSTAVLNLPIKSYSPTTVLFLHIQGYVPYYSVIPTWIVMSSTAVLNLHIKSYFPTTVLFLHIQSYVPYGSVIPT
jgi:hypothetical protein